MDIVLSLFIGVLVGFSTAALFSANAYEKGYKDALRGGAPE